MLSQQVVGAAHASVASDPTVLAQHWSKDRPDLVPVSLARVATAHQWLKPGDVLYVTEVRRHVLTDADLDAAAREVIGRES
jgi:hypothetical protein